MPDNENLKFSVSIDPRDAIREAKLLASKIDKALKSNVKGTDLQKEQDSLRAINQEFSKQKGILDDEKVIEDRINKNLENKAALLEKVAQLSELIAQREEKANILSQKEENYANRHADQPDTKRAILAKAQIDSLTAEVNNFDNRIVGLQKDIDYISYSLSKDDAYFEDMNNRALTFSQTWRMAGYTASKINNTLEGVVLAEEAINTQGNTIADTAVQATNAYSGLEQTVEGVSTAAQEAGASVKGAFANMNFAKADTNANPALMNLLQLLDHIRRIKMEMNMLREIEFPTAENNSRYHELNDALTNAVNHLHLYQQGTTEAAQAMSAIDQAIQGFANANGLLSGILNVLRAIGPAAQQASTISAAALAEATAGLSLIVTIITEVINAIRSIGHVLSSIWETAKNVFASIYDAVKKVIEAIGDLIDKIRTGLKNALDKVGKSADKAFSTSNLRRTLQMLTKYIFGVRSFFFLYRKLRKAVEEGLENLVQFQKESNETNTALTELRTSLLYLKNAWAAAFAPIINAVYPILVGFLDLLASVGNAIARFVAALTGQETVLQAVKVGAGDYADSLDKAGGSAGKAAKKQDELNDKLAAFDDLNVLGIDDDTSPSTGSGGGGGADDLLPSIDEMFERIKTPANDWVDMLKKAFESGDGFELGETIARYLNKGLEGAHEWLTGEGREKIQKIANLIGTTLDGILSDDKLAGNLGQVLADLFSNAMLFINTVITPERMYMIGVRMAEVLNTAIPQIVPELGKTLGNLLRSAISNAWGFISTADFASWGTALGEAINNFFAEMGTAKGVLGGIEFTHSGWQLFGMTVTEFATKILDFFINAIKEVDWEQVGIAIGEFFGSIDKNAIMGGLSRLWETIKSAFNELMTGLGRDEGAKDTLFSTLFSSVDVIVSHIPTWITGISNFIKNIQWDKIMAWVSTLPDKLDRLLTAIENIANALSPIAELIAEKFGDVGDAVDEGVTKVDRWSDSLQELSPVISSTAGTGAAVIADAVMPGSGAIASYVTSNLVEGIIDGVDAATDAVEQIVQGRNIENGIVSRIFGGGDGGGKFGTNIIESLKDIQENLKDTGDVADRVKGDFNFDSIATNIKGMVSESTNSLGEIPTKFTDIKSSADAQSTGIKDKFVTTFADIKNQSIEGAKAVQDNFLLASDNIKDSFINAWGEIKKSISEGGDMFVALSDGMGNTVKSLLNAMINGINVSITKPLQDISKSFNVLRTLDVNGSRPFAGIPYLNVPTIPHLAQGAVIPPNKQFMAVLGDQTSGTNIEAPLDTIRQAVGDELAPYLQQLIEINAQVITAINNKNLTIGDRQIGQANARYTARQNMIRGTSM